MQRTGLGLLFLNCQDGTGQDRACAEDGIPGASKVTVYLTKAPGIETRKVLRLREFLEARRQLNVVTASSTTFASILVNVHRDNQSKDTSENTSSVKPNEVLQGI